MSPHVSNKWEPVKAAGHLIPRRSHSAVCFNDKMLIFGGTNGFNYYNQLYEFDFKHKKWSLCRTSGQSPSPRYLHSACYVKDVNKIIIYGGYNDESIFGDMFEYDIDNKFWRTMNQSSIKPKFGHSAILKDYSMFVFGGFNGYISNELFEFNLINKNWNSIITYGNKPPEMLSHVAFLYADKMYIHGPALFEYNFERKFWTKIEVKGDIPQPIYRHSGVLHNNIFYIIGGEHSDKEIISDCYALNMISREWSILPKLEIGTRFSTVVVHQENLYLFGGSLAKTYKCTNAILTLKIFSNDQQRDKLFELLEKNKYTDLDINL